jgi:hypothetical protein
LGDIGHWETANRNAFKAHGKWIINNYGQGEMEVVEGILFAAAESVV